MAVVMVVVVFDWTRLVESIITPCSCVVYVTHL
jgi:hypothetical protein